MFYEQYDKKYKFSKQVRYFQNESSKSKSLQLPKS